MTTASPSPPLRTALQSADVNGELASRIVRYIEGVTKTTSPSVQDCMWGLVGSKALATGIGVQEETAEEILGKIGMAAVEGCGGLQEMGWVGTGCPIIDNTLGGGFVKGQVTELAGAAGVGKTQFLIQTCVRSLLPTPGGGAPEGCAVYIASEPFPATRAQQIAATASAEHPAVFPTAASLLTNVLISSRHATQTHWEHFVSSVQNVTRLADARRITVLVIDSVAAACSDLRNEAAVRTPLLSSIFSELKQLAHTHSFPIVVSNHVVSDLDSDVQEPKPALGLSWSSIPNTTIMLSKTPHNRVLTLANSPWLPNRKIGYDVLPKGVYGKPEE